MFSLVMATRKPLPSDEVLNILFDKLLVIFKPFCCTVSHISLYISLQFQLQLPPDKVAEMNMMSPQQKWSLILAQVCNNSEIHDNIVVSYFVTFMGFDGWMDGWMDALMNQWIDR